jgi:hypothetical protein
MSCSFIHSFSQLPPAPPPPPLPTLPTLPTLPGLSTMEPFGPPAPLGDLPDPPRGESLPDYQLQPTDDADWADGEAAGIVEGVMLTTGALASGSMAGALASLVSLSELATAFTPIDAPAPAGTDVDMPVAGEAPAGFDLTPAFPPLPDAPTPAGMAPFAMPEVPAYDAGELALADLELPDPATILLPDAPDLLPVSAPPPPDFILPPAPTLAELVIPDPPVLTLPLFEAELGARPDLPTVEFAYSEVAYQSQLLTDMTSALAGLIMDEHATGLRPDVEEAIWRRAASREARLTARATGEAARVLQARGFAMPAATLDRMVQQALSGGLTRASGFARAVAVERAQLAQQNLRFALESTIALESRLIDKHNAAQARALDAAKAMLAHEIAIFNAQVRLMQADVAAFAMKAEVFKVRLTSALAQISVFRAQIEAQIARGEVNAQKIAIYQAQIGGVRVIADTYRSQVEAARELTDANKARADQYQARIAAYQAEVTAKQSEYEAFGGAVRAQVERAHMFEKQVASYRSRVGAFDALVKAKVGVLDLQLKQTGDYPLEMFRAQIDAYRGASEATVEQLRSAASVYGAKIRAYVTTESAKTELADASVRVAQANAERALAEASALLDAGRANLANAEAFAGTLQNNVRTAGQLAGQMAAAAVAAQSVHASISESGSMGVSNSRGTSSSHSDSQAAVNSTSNSNSLNESHTRISGNTFNNVVSNSSGRHRNKGMSKSESIAYSNTTGNSITSHFTNSITSNISDNFSQSTECVDRTVHSD